METFQMVWAYQLVSMLSAFTELCTALYHRVWMLCCQQVSILTIYLLLSLNNVYWKNKFSAWSVQSHFALVWDKSHILFQTFYLLSKCTSYNDDDDDYDNFFLFHWTSHSDIMSLYALSQKNLKLLSRLDSDVEKVTMIMIMMVIMKMMIIIIMMVIMMIMMMMIMN